MSRFLIPSSSVAEEDKPISRFLPAKEPKPKDVFEEAESDPAVQSWFKELKSKHPDIPQATASEFMRQPQGMEGYNYEAALKAGVKPQLDPETGELHWGSADPQSGQILKGILHKTYGKELAAQQAQDAAKIEEQALGLPKEVEQRKDFDRSLATLNVERLAQEAFKAGEQADLVSPPKIAADAARQALRGIIPAVSPISPTVIPKSERELAASREFAPYAADTAIVAALAAHGNVPAIVSYGAFRAAQTGLDKLPKISETKAGKAAEEVMPETPLAGVGVGGLQAKIPTKLAMDIMQEGAKFWLAMKSGQFASGKYLQGIEAIKKLAPRAAVDTIKGEVIGKISGWMNEQGAAGAAMKSNPLEDPAIQQAVNDYSEFIYAKMMQQGGITPELAKKAQTLLFKRAADKALTSLSNMLPKMGRSTFFSGIPIPEELPKLRDILGAFKLSPEIMAQVEAGQMAALPAEALAAVKQQMPHLFSQAPQIHVSGKTAPPFPEKRQFGEPAAITPLRMFPEQLAKKGVSVTGRDNAIRILKDVEVKDIYGNKVTLPAGEEYTPYKLSNEQVLLQDGEQIVIKKGQIDQVRGAGFELKGGIFSEEEKGLKDVMLGDMEKQEFEDLPPKIQKAVEMYQQGELSSEGFESLMKAEGYDWREDMGSGEITNIYASGSKPTKYSQYQLPNGKNYRELLITSEGDDELAVLNKKSKELFGVGYNQYDGSAQEQAQKSEAVKRALRAEGKPFSEGYKSSHWDQNNVLAHVRMNDRIVDGKKILFVEEIQSDWAREGREKGFKEIGSKPANEEIERTANENNVFFSVNPKDGTVGITTREGALLSKEPYADKQEALDKYYKGYPERFGGKQGVPAHSLLKDWQEVALKRILNHAVKKGYDGIAWTTGEQQSERYDLSKQVDSVTIAKTPETYQGGKIRITAYKNGNVAIEKFVNNMKEAEGIIGKDLTAKAEKDFVLGKDTMLYEGQDLKIGGEWARNLYDKQIPTILKKLTKSDVGKVDINVSHAGLDKDDVAIQPYLEITPAVRQMVYGQPAAGGIQHPKGGKKGHRTLSGYVISRGGIDPQKFKAAGYNRKALSEYGMGHLFRKGGKAFDELAEELANEGLIQVPFDRNNTDVLLEALQGKEAYAFGDGDPTRKELQAQAKHWADQERIEKQQRDIDKKLGIDFDVEEIEAEVEKELISLINKAQKEAGKPSVLNIRDVKKVVRENAGITKISNLIKEEEALERSLQRQAAAAKTAYAEGKKEEAAKLRQQWLEDKAKKKLAEMTKRYIKDIHAIDTSEMSKINKENIEAIQELVDVAVPTEKTMASLRGTLEYMKDNPEADLPDYVIEDLKRLEMLNRSNMTFDQLESLRTAVKHYAALEKLKQKLRVGQQLKKFEVARDTSIGEMKDPKEIQKAVIESTDETKLKAKKVGQTLVDVFGINQDHYDLIIESIAKGGEESETFNVLFQQVKDGIRKELETKHNYVDLFRMEQKLRGLDKAVKNMAKWRKEKLRIGNFNLTHGQRVALLAHSRNEKNLTHLLEGGFAFKEDPYTIYKVSEEQLDDLLQSMTPEEKAYAEIQGIMSDAIYDDLNAVFQRKNGYDLPKEENYYRIKVARSELGKEQQEESILDEMKNKYVRIGLSKGFLNKRRAGAKQALILDDFFRDLNDHIHTAAAYVGLEEPLSNASKLLYDKEWRTEFNRRYGDNVWKQIEKGLRDIAGDFESYSDTENFFNYLKSAATKAIFSLNPSTIAKQVLSFPLAQLYVENKHLFQGLADYLSDREGVINRHKMFSPEFRERIETGGYERDVSDIFRHKAAGKLAGEKEDLSDFLLAGNRWMDKQTVAAVMQGAVLQKLEQLEGSGLSPEEKLKQAYEFADYVVNRTLSTSAVEHRSAMSRGSVIDRMMTFATTDTNQQLNMIRRFWRNYQRTKDPKERSKAFKSLMLILAHAGITIPLGNAMIDWTMDTLYRRKEKPKFSAKFFAKNMASQVAGLMYIVRDVVSSFINKADKGTFAGQDITYPSFQILNNVADSAANLYRGMTMHKEKDLLKGVDGLAEILFMLRGLPYRTPKKMITSAVGEITGQPRRSEGQKKSKGGSRFLSGGGGGSSSGSGGSRFLR